ncbi:hypothetical protein Y032_0107g3780 [Ancylostoma ceylanicum]|uniref:Uncharacterized protein n=1 Tax=Ancylostoma ceylanicum TaxID=53326 RepID=A0A016TEK2_9BILA|nr:hypothetical protein Y032_0107g3780 [Ancylostoma ceylanicum]
MQANGINQHYQTNQPQVPQQYAQNQVAVAPAHSQSIDSAPIMYVQLQYRTISSVCSKSLSAIRSRLMENSNFSFLKWPSQLVSCHGCGIRFFQRQSKLKWGKARLYQRRKHR